MMTSKKADPPTISSKEVECEIATMAGEQKSQKADDLKSMFKDFMTKQDSIAKASQQTNESILSAMSKVISSVSHQKQVKIPAHPPSQDAPLLRMNLFSPSEVTEADMDAEEPIEIDGEGDGEDVGEGEWEDGDASSDEFEGWLPPSGKISSTQVQNPSSL